MRVMARRVVSAPETSVPLDVILLVLHAKDALDSGELDVASADLDLALRRCGS